MSLSGPNAVFPSTSSVTTGKARIEGAALFSAEHAVISTDIVKGKHGRYFWIQCALDIQDTSRHLSLLVQKCPDVLLN
jgi:hypothetical protein